MKVRTNTQRKNTYNFLVDIYNSTNKDYTKIPLADLIKKHHISGITSTTLIKNKVILKKNRGYYKWNSIQPNYKMVEKILDFNLEYSKMLNESKKCNFITEDKKEIKVTNTNTNKEFVKPKQPKKLDVQKSFSLFWGLIKINY